MNNLRNGNWHVAYGKWLSALCHKLFAAQLTRRAVLAPIILSLIGGSFPFDANAAVPTWVVEFDANTQFEQSLERFLFDLFNTLQRRQEDFTAAFELQKIEKAREDVNKLFQETQEELQNYGQSLDFDKEAKVFIRDPRFTGDPDPDSGETGLNCQGTDVNNPGCTPMISPLKDSRIIHDPYQYLFGDAYLKAEAYLYCYFNYLAWDQLGILGTYNDSYKKLGFDPDVKQTFDTIGKKTAGGSFNALIATRNTLVTMFHRGNTRLMNYPFFEIYGNIGQVDNNLNAPPDPNSDVVNNFKVIEPRCRQVMVIVAGESPVTVAQNVQLWKQLNHDSGLPEPTDAEINSFRNLLANFPTLQQSITQREFSWKEFSAAADPRNNLEGQVEFALKRAIGIINETQTERQATYIAGHGIRPENLYVTLKGLDPGQDGIGTPEARYRLNTEYVISPAIMLLQKMQAATQAMFDLAGQGFLYLDAEETPQEVLGAYNLVSTRGQNEERRICNNAGSCVLLDPWLKPAADFRSVAALNLNLSKPDSDKKVPLIGVSFDKGRNQQAIAGTGLPAPWEDEGLYLRISNEKVSPDGENPTDIRYTIARFRNRLTLVNGVNPGNALLGGSDEFNPNPTTKQRGMPRHQDNAGMKLLGFDYPINDWYDRVIEMYEPGIGVNDKSQNLRPHLSRDFEIRDWQCYVALWFFAQEGKRVGEKGMPATYFLGLSPDKETTDDFTRQYCKMLGGGADQDQ